MRYLYLQPVPTMMCSGVLHGVTNYQSADQCLLFEASLLNVKSIDLIKDVDEIKPNR